jgi:formylglycine-generating enzyme required for sulfatase activity
VKKKYAGTLKGIALMLLAIGFLNVAQAKIIGHWPLDGDLKDASGNGYDGTVSEDPLEFAEGKHGQAADFYGASIINCGNVPLGTNGQLTVAMWVKPSRVEQAFAGFVQKQNTDYSERSFWMGQHPQDGYFAWAQFTPPTAKGTQLKTSKAVLANNEWTHVAITMDGAYQKIYVNGVLDMTSEKRDSGIVDGGDNLRFGRVENTPGGRYSGLMDDIWIFDEALSESEIYKLMTGPNGEEDSPELSATGSLDKKEGSTPLLTSGVSTELPYYTYENRKDAGFDSVEAVKRQVESAKALGMSVVETLALPEDVLLEMRICPAGEFPLGSPDSEKGREKDEALRRGVFPQPSYLSTYPLTQEQYQAIMQALPTGTDVLNPGYAARVSYAQTREELIPAMQPYARKGWRIELVTMDQMEYATRAGTLETWYTGKKQAEVSNAAWHKFNSGGKEHPVGQKLPNAWGFHDTLGNVWQWVTGFSDERDNFPGEQHVVKGGGFDSPPGKNGCRSANVMVQKIPSGVRVAMVKIPEEKLPAAEK